MAPRTRTAKQPVHLKITIDGVPYTFDLMGSSTMDRLELFRQSGLTMPQVAEAFRQRQYETFFVAAFEFLARRQMGQPASFMTIADAITWDSDIEMEDLTEAQADEDDSAPKAPDTSGGDEPQS